VIEPQQYAGDQEEDGAEDNGPKVKFLIRIEGSSLPRLQGLLFEM
jgi:hypothetical protein